MKRYVFAALTAVILIGLCACSDSNQAKLRHMCEACDKDLPIDIGAGVFKSIVYEQDENCVEMSLVADESIINISDLRKANNELEDYLCSFMSQKDNAAMLELLKATHASVRLSVSGTHSKETATFTLSPEDLSTIETSDDTDENYRHQLDRIVASSNAQCPSDLGDGLTMESVTLDSTYVCYNFIYDPAQLSFEDAEDSWQEIYDSLSEQVTTPGLSHTFDILKALGYGIRYSYRAQDGSKPETIITFEPEDVKEM